MISSIAEKNFKQVTAQIVWQYVEIYKNPETESGIDYPTLPDSKAAKLK